MKVYVVYAQGIYMQGIYTVTESLEQAKKVAQEGYDTDCRGWSEKPDHYHDFIIEETELSSGEFKEVFRLEGTR